MSSVSSRELVDIAFREALSYYSQHGTALTLRCMFYILVSKNVTIDQIIDMQLPAKPESLDEINKMRRDPRYRKYIERIMSMAETDERVKKLVEFYGSPEIRVELDALVALRPDDFKQILRRAIEKYFDWNIYNTVTRAREEELRKKAEELKKQAIENIKTMLAK
jgi:phosphomannomutase